MTPRTPDDRLLDDAEAFSRAFGVSVRASIAAIEAGEELERLALAHHEKNPHLTSEQASVEVLNTPKGGELYATANPRPRGKTKAVQADPRNLYLARAALSLAMPPDRPAKVTEAKLVNEALRLFVAVLADDETPARTAVVAAFRD